MVNPFAPQAEPALLGDATVGSLMLVKGSSFVVSAPSGDIVPPGAHGLFVRSRRALNRWQLSIDGRPLQPLSADPTTSSSATVVARTAPGPGHAASDVLVVLRRRIGDGMSDELSIRHYGPAPRRLSVTLEVGTDFADIFSVKDGRAVAVDRVDRVGEPAADAEGPARLLLTWVEDGEARQTTVSAEIGSGGGAVDLAAEQGRLSWSGWLPPRGEAVLHLRVQASVAGRSLPEPPEPGAAVGPDSAAAGAVAWRRGVPVLATPDWRLQRAWDQALDDVGALRMPAPGTDGADGDEALFDAAPANGAHGDTTDAGGRDALAGRSTARATTQGAAAGAAGSDSEAPALPVVAAGAPWFMALFGRDSLITSWFALMADPDLALGVLDALARLQGRHEVDATEEQPGRVMHEMRPGGPRGSHVYYGTADATPLFVMLLGEAAEWGLPPADVRRLLPPPTRPCAGWPTTGTGTGTASSSTGGRHPDGLENQGWKDSHDAVRFADGRLATAPIALAEVQGYVYGAYRARARLATLLGDGRAPQPGAGRRSGCRKRSTRPSGSRTRAAMPSRWMPARSRSTRRCPTPATACGPGWCPPTAPSRSPTALVAEDLWTGFGVRTMGGRPPATTRCHTTAGRSGPTTR